MELKRFRIHPLFFAAGILSALTGRFLLFLAATLCALLHECAHASAARRYGYTLDKVVLMPYGAVIAGDIAGIPKRQQLAVLLAGPLANFATGVFFVALWWTFPESYPYTELAADVSFSLFFVNLLPAYPLDGGRILRLLLDPIGTKRAKAVCTVLSLLISAGVFVLFVLSCFGTPDFSALLFAILLAAGAAGGGSYERLTFSIKRLEHGIEERRIAVRGTMSAREALRFLREDRYLTLLVYGDDGFLGEITEEEFLGALNGGAYEQTLAGIVG